MTTAADPFAAAAFAGAGDGSDVIRYGGGVIYSQTVIRIRAPRLVDDAGTLTPQRDWAHASTTTLVGVSVQPKGTSEQRDAAGVLTTDEWTLHGRRGVRVDLVNGDRVLWDGRTLDVIGEPQAWPGLLSGWHHSEITLKRSPFTRLTASGAAAQVHDAELNAAGTQQTFN